MTTEVEAYREEIGRLNDVIGELEVNSKLKDAAIHVVKKKLAAAHNEALEKAARLLSKNANTLRLHGQSEALCGAYEVCAQTVRALKTEEKK